MKKPTEEDHTHIFNKGDICCNQWNHLKVIHDIVDNYYQWIYTETEYAETLTGRISWQKGTLGSQHVSVFDKYHYLFQPFAKR